MEGRTNDAYHCEGNFASRFTHSNVLKIYENRCQITPKWLPFRSLVRPGVLQGLEDHPGAPKSTPKGIPRRPKGALWSLRGVPRATKRPQRAPRGSPRALLGGLGEGKSRKSRSPRQKKSILVKVLRDSPLPMRGTLWTPPNRSKIDPECSKVRS